MMHCLSYGTIWMYGDDNDNNLQCIVDSPFAVSNIMLYVFKGRKENSCLNNSFSLTPPFNYCCQEGKMHRSKVQ